MLIDSDLIGINEKNISDLINPVINQESDISISLKQNSLLIFKILGLDFVLGERVFKKGLIDEEFSHITGFGFETFMNKKIMEKKLRLKVVRWYNVSHERKSEKVGFLKGTLKDIIMINKIIKTSGIFGMLKQILFMNKLKVK